MKRKSKPINDDVLLLEEKSLHSGNTVKSVKILGIYSRNGRVYPLNVMRDALSKYEGVVVNLDHKPNEPRSVMDRFGKLENCRMGEDGIYGDLVYNPEHPYAKAFEYFVNNQPTAIGLSHAAIARTKMDRIGNETVEEITDLESVDLVAVPATNRNLFESYNLIMESMMSKDEKKVDKKEEAEVSLPLKRKYVPEEEKDDKKEEAMADKKNLPHVSEKSYKEAIEEMADKEYESYEAYCKDMKEAVNALLGSELSHDDKLENIMGLLAPKHEGEDADSDDKKEEGKAPMVFDEAKDCKCDDKVKAEESIRKSASLGHKLLLEELDAYRTRDKELQTVAKIRDFCAKSGLDEKLVTETFVETLKSVSESKWETLVSDRKNIASTSKLPISFAGEVAANQKPLTVDELVKKLRS